MISLPCESLLSPLTEKNMGSTYFVQRQWSAIYYIRHENCATLFNKRQLDGQSYLLCCANAAQAPRGSCRDTTAAFPSNHPLYSNPISYESSVRWAKLRMQCWTFDSVWWYFG